MTIWDPEDNYAAARRGRKRRGIGPEGLARIREDLKEFKEPLYEEVDEGPPEEPPEEDSEPEGPKLPPPEEIHPINQSTKGGFSTPRPDRHVEFWSAADSKQSTRVASAQWIPVSMSEAGVVGDLFIAFARPHKGKSTLFLYKGKSDEVWQEFKGTTSFGKFIPRLGAYSEHSESDYAMYKDLHPDQGWWIFNSSWTTIRANNESVVGGPKTPRGVVKRVAASALEEAERIIRERQGD